MAAAAASRSGANHAAPLLAASSSSFSSLQQRRRWASSPSPRLLRARASSPGQEGEGEGEVYEVKESEDDLWAAIALPVTMSSAEGQQVEYLVLDTDGALAEPAIESYLGQLQAERSAEAAALEGAKSEAAARGGGGGDDWALDPTLLKRMATVRDAERGLIVQVGGCGCVPTRKSVLCRAAQCAGCMLANAGCAHDRCSCVVVIATHHGRRMERERGG